MLEKLEQIEARYEALTEEMSSPEVFSDPANYAKLNKQHRSLGEIVSKYRQWKQLKSEHAGAKELFESSDEEEMRELARAEVAALEAQLQQAEEDLRILLLPRDPNDEKNVILEIRAGTGGDEATLFAAEMLRMYGRYAERQGWKMEILDQSESGIGGLKEAVASISGDKVYSKLKHESGVHRVQRVPQTETSGRIHTSAVTVAVLPEAEEVDIDIKPDDIEINCCRASGKGGQGVNTTDSAVQIIHKPTGLMVRCADERSQQKNRAKALTVLRSRLLDRKVAEENAKYAAQRKDQVGTGERSEKIRTYNFPQNRITDHRINLNLYKLDAIIMGNLEELIRALKDFDKKQRLGQV
jgi:peptide chain release factor 1